MTILSMTGFARISGFLEAGNGSENLAASQSESFSWSWELKTVNSRVLDIKLRLPPLLERIEPIVRSRIAAEIGRGACQIQLQLTRKLSDPQLTVNEDVLMRVHASLARVSENLGEEKVPLQALLGIKGVLEYPENGMDEPTIIRLEKAVIADLDKGLIELNSSRSDEGRALLQILQSKIRQISELVTHATNTPGRLPEAVLARLTKTLTIILDAAPALDPQRLHQEAVLLAGKADICEELDRLNAHVDAANVLLKTGGQIGRKLDFLAQEFTREANTLCSKSNDIELTRHGLEMKVLIEQFREQVQNVE